MVLEDLNASSDSFPDNPSSPGSDSQSPSSFDPRIEASQFPQPIPVFGPVLGFSALAIASKAQQTIGYAQRRVHRTLTVEEARGLAFHVYKMEQTKSYFAAIGVSAGSYRWYSTFSTYRYPFYLPKPEDINPNRFMFVKGPLQATVARQSWRFACYFLVGSAMGKLIGGMIAQPVAARDTANDPRLAQFALDLKVANDEDLRKQRERFSQGVKGGNENPSQGLPPHAGAPRPLGQPRQAPPPEDDMSPTAGNDPWPVNSSDSSYGDFGFSSEPQQPVQENGPSRPQPTQPTSSWGGRPSRPQEDDASPTGGLFQDETENQSKAGESAWERLRRAGGPPPGPRPGMRRPTPPNGEQREPSTMGDSWTFAESDDERQRAREQAQKEFDVRMERERQGKDFNDEKRW
ncbi:uncharacterized protein BDR25DRAFT_259735 [Lindgomyces ingoldianus]|uniref:Uncharacterized protein n=1 Tax=Lindgomyces ingoldianus TaxID=673940 RepID=A0ACB6R1M8_9PLEO|nr:uncharacterized protein BDR25DRAFT_259735 [Lindgomyces ingoldianus]KAF2472235.1 hypothetical protein BDR25DRAFT_259735 [Lindgomyces ingoldianus]